MTEQYPKREYEGQPSTNMRARGIVPAEKQRTMGKRGPRVSSQTPQVASRAFGEPTSGATPIYPYNHVQETASGHLIEYDDSPGNERVNIQHRSGSKVEFRADGSITIRANNNLYEIVAGDKDAIVRGSVNIVVESNADIRVKGDSNIQCDGDWNALVQGSYNLEVQGNYNVRVHGDELTRTSGSTLRETRGNVIQRNLSNFTERTVGDHRNEIGGSQYNTVEGEIHEMSYGQYQGSYHGGLFTLNGVDADGEDGAGAITVATIQNTESMDGMVVRLATSLDVSGPARATSVDATSARITTTTGNLVGQATYSVNAADLLSSITALRGLSLPNLSALAGGLGTNILNNIGVGVLSDLQGQLSSITNSVRGGVMGAINSAYSSVGGVFSDLSNITSISNLTGAIQGFNFNYNIGITSSQLSSLQGIEGTISGITDLTDTSWFTNTAQYHELLSGLSQNLPQQQAISAARAALERATELGISEAALAASAAFTNFSSLADIEANVNGFISDLGSLNSELSTAATTAITTAATNATNALSASVLAPTGAPGNLLPFTGITSPVGPVPPIPGSPSAGSVVDVTGTSDPLILELDRQPVTGHNVRRLNTYEVVARARNRALRSNQDWLQDQLDNGAILSSITSATPPRTRRTGVASQIVSPSQTLGKASGAKTVRMPEANQLRIQGVPQGALLTEGISRTSSLSPNFNVSHMLAGDNLSAVLKAQAGLSVAQIAQNMQLLAYNVLEPLRDKYHDTWTIAEGLYNLLPNEQIDSSSVTVDMVRGLGVGIQFVSHDNSFYFDAAQWIRTNLVFDKMILSYIDYDPAEINEPTLIITVKPGQNARSVSTEFNHVKVADNILDLSND